MIAGRIGTRRAIGVRQPVEEVKRLDERVTSSARPCCGLVHHPPTKTVRPSHHSRLAHIRDLSVSKAGRENRTLENGISVFVLIREIQWAFAVIHASDSHSVVAIVCSIGRVCQIVGIPVMKHIGVFHALVIHAFP